MKRLEKNAKKTWQKQMMPQMSNEAKCISLFSKLLLKKILRRRRELLMKRKQSKTIIQSRKVLEPWFRIKTIKGTFVPSIRQKVTKIATLIQGNIDSSPILVNSCSTVSTVRISVLFNMENIISILFDVVK